MCEMGMMRAPDGQNTGLVLALPGARSEPSSGPQCPNFSHHSPAQLVPCLSHETVGSMKAGLDLSYSAQHLPHAGPPQEVPERMREQRGKAGGRERGRAGRREGGKKQQSQLLPTPGPAPWLQSYLLFFLFGFLGTCSQGFL